MFLGSYVVIIILVVAPCMLFVTYTLAVTSRHVNAFWPFISYVGNRPVECCIFSLSLSLCSALLALIVLLRYAQMCDVIEKSEMQDGRLRKMTRLNASSRVFGLLGAFGLCIVASFQQRNLVSIHVVGVFLCTYLTLTYFIVQTYFSFTLASEFTKKSVKLIRLIAVVFSTFILVCIPVLIIYSYVERPHKLRLAESRQHQSGTNIQSALLEWALLILGLLFIASFYPDMKKVSLKSDQIILLE